ncbi:MAG: type II secretion system F family protein [Anaerolineales bacterium]
MVWIGVLVLSGLVIAAIILVIIGIRESSGGDPLAQRLAEYAQRGEVATLEEIELSQPFMERVVYPTAKRVGELVQRFTPQNAVVEARQKLDRAAAPRWLEPTLFLASRLIFGLGLGILLFFAFSLSPTRSPFSLQGLLLIALFTVIGFYLPNLLVERRIRQRQKVVRNTLPDALDLLTICVEAGLGFDAGLKKVVEKWDNALSLAFARVLREIQLGKLRRDALKDMAERVDIPELDSFVAAVVQSETMGVSMARVLRVQSDSMRVKRRQRAEENAQRAPIKMLLPMALLVFPTILIVLLGPAILQIMRSQAIF